MKKAAEAKRRVIALVGSTAFYVGLIIAIAAAFVAPSGWLYLGLAVVGLVVGVLNITARETGPYLLASIAFIVTALGIQQLVRAAGWSVPIELVRLAANISVLVGVGALIIALLAIYQMAKGR